MVRVIDPTMGGEDFSFLAKEVPSVLARPGQNDWSLVADDGQIWALDDCDVHNRRFVLNEGVLRAASPPAPRAPGIHSHRLVEVVESTPSVRVVERVRSVGCDFLSGALTSRVTSKGWLFEEEVKWGRRMGRRRAT